ncbi:hypothetical protein D3C86_2027920 [compost metagenome]
MLSHSSAALRSLPFCAGYLAVLVVAFEALPAEQSTLHSVTEALLPSIESSEASCVWTD